jgi:hypothetical protein
MDLICFRQMKARWIAILACAAAAQFRVSRINPFGAKMFSEAGVSVRDLGRNWHTWYRSLYQ